MQIKKIQLLILTTVLLATTTSWAQKMVPSTRSECTRKCNSTLLKTQKFGGELTKIRDAIAKETDPEKLKELRQKEKEELERATEKVADACEEICQHNPD
ncbi:hypothetical protein H8L32_22250 [Undibacterium sp. CY18W]|uniref:Uncharacterized protein n=1 Tax=Undibacterium hunanense TaxID=2762292 RepID=A0ABR6ZWF9_9BURK|nr:hypothetical protein [Undibacterium hunanense]MBC3920202.1 hypothetical protein [Undibacterium hunanense]